MQRLALQIFCLIALLWNFSPATAKPQGVFKYRANGKYLAVEVLNDDIVHFEWSSVGEGPAESGKIETSPMVGKTDYDGANPNGFANGQGFLETTNLKLEIDPQSLCLTLDYKPGSLKKITRIC